MDDDLPPTVSSVTDSGLKSQTALNDLVAKATAKYAVKDYSAAAELYSQATELQAELNGEMSVQNADLLYFYGRCLYHVAVQNSDVLGTKVAGEERRREAEKTDHGSSTTNKATELHKVHHSVMTAEHSDDSQSPAMCQATGLESSRESQEDKVNGGSTSTPFFNITGDENWDDSEDELVGNGAVVVEDDDQPEDDFSNAFEVLDIARVLLERRLADLDHIEDHEGNDSEDAQAVEITPAKKRLRERLADT